MPLLPVHEKTLHNRYPGKTTPLETFCQILNKRWPRDDHVVKVNTALGACLIF